MAERESIERESIEQANERAAEELGARLAEHRIESDRWARESCIRCDCGLRNEELRDGICAECIAAAWGRSG